MNSEERQGSPEPPVQSPASLPDLANASYWLGGAPPGVFPTPPALLGCLGALIVDREGYDPLDTPNRHGVEHGCGTRVSDANQNAYTHRDHEYIPRNRVYQNHVSLENPTVTFHLYMYMLLRSL